MARQSACWCLLTPAGGGRADAKYNPPQCSADAAAATATETPEGQLFLVPLGERGHKGRLVTSCLPQACASGVSARRPRRLSVLFLSPVTAARQANPFRGPVPLPLPRQGPKKPAFNQTRKNPFSYLSCFFFKVYDIKTYFHLFSAPRDENHAMLSSTLR